MTPDDRRPSTPIKVQFPDELKHFSRDGPVVRLLALLICRMPKIILAFGSLGSVAVAVLAYLRWWT